MSAPHLPPKLDDLIPRSALQSLPWMLFLIGVSALTSIAITLATIVWLAPNVIPQEFITNSRERNLRGNAVLQLNPAVANDVRRRLWVIRDRRQKLNGGFYPVESAEYQAMMFSSDGWMVAAVPEYRIGAERGWEIADYQGQARALERVVHDPVGGLTYIKVAGEGLPFAVFSSWEEIGPGSGIWLSHPREGWRGVELDQPVFSGAAQRYRAAEPQWQYRLPPPAKPGQIVIDKAGALVGFVDDKSALIEGWMVENQYVSILGTGKTRYTTAPWLGTMVDGFVSDSDGVGARRVSGFYVSGSPTRATSSTVGIGDVVIRIQNKPVDSVTLARRILFAPERFPVTVSREGEEVDIMVEKEKVQ